MPSDSPIVLDLPFDGTASGIARRHSAEVLDCWHLQELVDAVSLITSELVTNAVCHGQEPVSLTLSRGVGNVRIAVHDADPKMPRVRVVDEATSESGRGLRIVDVLSRASGIDAVPGDGKIAWAVVAVAPFGEG